jgi:hypothetical protein
MLRKCGGPHASVYQHAAEASILIERDAPSDGAFSPDSYLVSIYRQIFHRTTSCEGLEQPLTVNNLQMVSMELVPSGVEGLDMTTEKERATTPSVGFRCRLC